MGHELLQDNFWVANQKKFENHNEFVRHIQTKKLTSLSATAVPYISMDAVNTTSSYHWETWIDLK